MFNNRKYYIKNMEKHKKQMEEYRKNNPEKIKEYSKQRYQNNIEKIKEQNKQYYNVNKKRILNYKKLWKNNNPAYYKQYFSNRRKTNLKINLCHRMSTAIGYSLKGNKNGRHWENLVGYTLNALLKWLKFNMPQEYTWENFLQGKLHIDHIIPIRAFVFKKPEDKEFKQCWSLYNLQLLSTKENRLKHDKITNPILLGLLLKEMI